MTDPHRVYARALVLTCDEWMSVIAFPSACATVGKRCPKWVRDLCELAEAIGPTVPSELLDALGRSEPQKKTADCEPNAAIMGKEAGLCVVEWGTGSKVFGRDSTTAVPPSGDRDQPKALPPSIDHEGEQDRSSASGVTSVAMPDSVRAKDTT